MRPVAGLVDLLVADMLSAVGSRITMVAIPWLVLVTTGSAAGWAWSPRSRCCRTSW